MPVFQLLFLPPLSRCLEFPPALALSEEFSSGFFYPALFELERAPCEVRSHLAFCNKCSNCTTYSSIVLLPMEQLASSPYARCSEAMSAKVHQKLRPNSTQLSIW